MRFFLLTEVICLALLWDFRHILPYPLMLNFVRNILRKKPTNEEEYLPLEVNQDSSVPMDGPWIGVDLDGTLAIHDLWVSKNHIGNPVLPMLNRVKSWINQGIRVKIVTARACQADGIPPVKAWLKKQGLPDLEVTNEKDFGMIELWDDRAIQVIPNTGQPVLDGTLATLPKAPIGNFDKTLGA
jgi:hypothetical protein